MKQNDVAELPILGDYELENIFNVHTTPEGHYFYNLVDTVRFPKDLAPTLYDTYSIGPGDHWNTISYKYYGTIKLWWLICAVNNIDNPMIMPPPGFTIKVIKSSVVPHILSQLK